MAAVFVTWSVSLSNWECVFQHVVGNLFVVGGDDHDHGVMGHHQCGHWMSGWSVVTVIVMCGCRGQWGVTMEGMVRQFQI